MTARIRYACGTSILIGTPGWTAVTWYDRKTRCYVTQLKDGDGNQVGEAEYNAKRADAVEARGRASRRGWAAFGY